MKDQNIDLCGELGHADTDDFAPLSRDAHFCFACNGCGDCCRGREDIVLSGYDLYRIAGRLGLPPRMVVRAFCRQYIGTQSHMPVVRLAPLREERNNCPFLHKNRCAIHEAEPLVCALYPLGQQIDLDGTIDYFAQQIDCGGQIIEARVRDFLDRYSIAEREEIDAHWALTCIRLSKQMRQWEQSLQPVILRRLQAKLLEALYYDYDPAQPYPPQRDENLRRFEQEAQKLAGMQIRPKSIKKTDR